MIFLNEKSEISSKTYNTTSKFYLSLLSPDIFSNANKLGNLSHSLAAF